MSRSLQLNGTKAQIKYNATVISGLAGELELAALVVADETAALAVAQANLDAAAAVADEINGRMAATAAENGRLMAEVETLRNRPPADGSDPTLALADDLMVLVLSWVDRIADDANWKALLVVAPAVCRRWKTLCKTRMAVRFKSEWSDPLTALTDRIVVTIAERFRGFHSLTLAGCHSVTPAVVNALATPALTHLNIDDTDIGGCEDWDCIAFFKALLRASNDVSPGGGIRSMTLVGLGNAGGNCDWNDAPHMAWESITTHCPLLDSLVLADCGDVCDLASDSLEKLRIGCPKLRSLTLESVWMTEPGGAQSAMNGNFCALATLQIMSSIDDTSLRVVLAACPALQHLYLWADADDRGLTGAGLECIARTLPKLRSFRLGSGWSRRVVPQLQTGAGLVSVFRGCKELQEVQLGTALSGSISTILTVLELDLRGHTHVRGAPFSCPRLTLADMVLI